MLRSHWSVLGSSCVTYAGHLRKRDFGHFCVSHTVPAASSHPPAPARSGRPGSRASVPGRTAPAGPWAVSRMCPCARGHSEARRTGGAISCPTPTRWWRGPHVTRSGKGLRQRPCALLTASSPATSKGELPPWPWLDRWQSSPCITPEPRDSQSQRGHPPLLVSSSTGNTKAPSCAG